MARAARRDRSRSGGPGDPAALTPAEAARLLGVPVDVVKAHLDAGAPADPDGRLNLVHYAAWLLARQRPENPDGPPPPQPD